MAVHLLSNRLNYSANGDLNLLVCDNSLLGIGDLGVSPGTPVSLLIKLELHHNKSDCCNTK
jgi:hypothetical protein